MTSRQVHLQGGTEVGSFRLQVDLALEPQEIVAVVGPNGAGKSTLLRTLAGLNALQSGQIQVGERVLDNPDKQLFVPPERRNVGLVFQSYRLFPHLSVRDNVGFSVRAQGGSRREARHAATTWVRRLGLEPLADRRPSQLSGGQSQRVAIARALASEPDLLLLDEPLAALDQRTRTEVRSGLREYLRTFPGPVLMVTHDPIDAMVMADRLVVIEDGQVVQDATPAEVARRPRTTYIAKLVGLNLYSGQHDPTSDAIVLDDGGVLHATRGDEDALGDRRMLVTVRPTAISVHPQRPGPASPRNVWAARITSLETLGDRVRLATDGNPPAIVDLTPDAVADLDLQIGGEVWFSAKATEVLAYPESPRTDAGHTPR